MCLRFAWLPLLSLLLAVPARADDLLRAIDSRRQAGRIDDETRHYYRVAALRDRAQLPSELRSLPLPAGRRHDPTRIMVEAMQWIIGNHAQGGRLQRLMGPPTDLAHVLDSTTLPIRVSYPDGVSASQAQAVLAATEQSWRVMTQDYGFTTPAIEPGYDRYRVYLDETDPNAAAYTAPYAEDPATERSDCYSYIVYSPYNPSHAALSTMAHELNHAMQSALDCTESWPFMENTSTYIETHFDPSSWEYAYYLMEVFQENPWRALDYNNYGSTDGYEYGGMLWPVYLTATYAPQNGPVFMRQAWEACVQNDHYNSKDYFEAVEEVVAAAGGPTHLEEVFADFSEARYFVGIDSDGQHIPGAGSFSRCEVAPALRFGTTSLPITDGKPTTDKQPAPYASNHILLTLAAGYQHVLRVSFDGSDETRWAARVLLIGNGDTESQSIPLDESTQSGQLEVDPSGRSKLVLMVANLALSGYSPNDHSWTPADYRFRVEPVPPAPTLVELVPAELEQNAYGVTMTLKGQGFVGGPDFGVTFDDPTIFVASVTSVTDTEVKFVMSLPPGETQPGPKTITVTNTGGKQAVGPDFLTVIPPKQDAGTGGDDGGSGCGCRTAAPAPDALAALLALGLLLLRRRR